MRAGIKPKSYGIRLDSGDLAYLSKKARKMLDDAGFPDAVIAASNDLDEYLIHDLKMQGAAITSWGGRNESDHFKRLPVLWRCIQAGSDPECRRTVYPEDQDLRKYREDHKPGK